MDHCVYRSDHSNSLNHTDTGLKLKIDKACIEDPTLQRRNDIRCPAKICGSTQAVTFSQPTKDRLNLIFVCTACTYHWVKE